MEDNQLAEKRTNEENESIVYEYKSFEEFKDYSH